MDLCSVRAWTLTSISYPLELFHYDQVQQMAHVDFVLYSLSL